MNFTKPNRATIRYTNSQWLSEDATEASVGKVAGPVEVRLEASLREIVGLFGTWGWHWTTCGQGGRGEGMIDDGFATRECP